MKKLLAFKLSASVVSMFTLLIGCTTSGDGTQAAWNKMQEERKSPVRLIKDESSPDKNSTRLIEGWAGVPGKSAINGKYQEMTFASIQKNCGYGKAEFIETYIVNHGESSWEEVWLFNDSKSHRDDKVSGLTIFYQYDSQTNKTDVQFFGHCHTGKGTSFVFM